MRAQTRPAAEQLGRDAGAAGIQQSLGAAAIVDLAACQMNAAGRSFLSGFKSIFVKRPPLKRPGRLAPFAPAADTGARWPVSQRFERTA